MSIVRRYWGPAVILIIVVVHAAAIGYVRSRVAQLNTNKSNAVEIGSFRFQPQGDPATIYHFHLHVIVDPAKRGRGIERLEQMRLDIRESTEQLLRQVDPKILDDPTQNKLRDHLMDVVGKHLEETLAQRVLITDWLKLPATTLSVDLNSKDNVFAVN